MDKSKIVSMISGMFFAACACSAQPPDPVKPIVSPEKILIVCYSRSGNTLHAAEVIRKTTSGTLFELKPEKPYSSEFIACVKQAKAENRDNIDPELKALPEDMSRYEVIFVGSPNWFGTMAPPVRTFLKRCDLKGKTLIPFFTHGGGGMQKCETDFRKACPESKVLPAGSFPGKNIRNADAEIQTFVHSRIELKPDEAQKK